MARILQPSMKWGSSRRFGDGHNGIDYKYPMNTPVTAAADGVIDFEGWGENDPWTLAAGGIYVRIKHSDGSYTGYAHLSSTTVNKGQSVKAGERIGLSGSTGNSTGPHLHFEVIPKTQNWENGYAARIDPEPFFISATPSSKGGKTVNETDLNALYKYGPLALGGYQARGRKAKEGSNVYLGKSAAFVLDDFFNSKEAKDKRAAEKKKLSNAIAARDAKARELAAEKSKAVGLVTKLSQMTNSLKEERDKRTAAEKDLALANGKIQKLEAADKPVPSTPTDPDANPGEVAPPHTNQPPTTPPVVKQTSLDRLFEAIALWFVSHTKKN